MSRLRGYDHQTESIRVFIGSKNGMNEGFMEFDRLLEYKRYCLAGDNGSAIAGSIDDLIQQHGACAAEA
jgi:hypothetical protein